MNDSEHFRKPRSSFAFNSAQGWKKGRIYIYKKNPLCLFNQGHRTWATEPLHKERDGSSKTGMGGHAAYEAPGNTDTVDPDFWKNTQKKDGIHIEFHAAATEEDLLRGVTLNSSCLLTRDAV